MSTIPETSSRSTASMCSAACPSSPARDAWNGNILLIEPHHQLKATGNVLHVESRNSRGQTGGDIDDFIIDNVVIVYKMPDVSCDAPLGHRRSRGLRQDRAPAVDHEREGLRRHGGPGRPAQRIRAPDGVPAGRVARRLPQPARRLLGPGAHLQAQQISSTYNVVQFLDTPSGRTYLRPHGRRARPDPGAATHPLGRDHHRSRRPHAPRLGNLLSSMRSRSGR